MNSPSPPTVGTTSVNPTLNWINNNYIRIWQHNFDQNHDCLCFFVCFLPCERPMVNIPQNVTLHHLLHRLPWKQSKMAAKHVFFLKHNFFSVGNKLVLLFACHCYREYLYVYVTLCVCHTYNNFNDFVSTCKPNNQGRYHSNTHNPKHFTCISKS